MKYKSKMVREFPGKIAGDDVIFEDLSNYLSTNGVRNIVNAEGNGSNWYVLAQIPKNNDLEMLVSFDECTLSRKTKMTGEITSKYNDKESRIAASKLFQVLSAYMPSPQKEDEDEE
ncbi:Uncharacterised protein [uncultured archaeon]|nr:Uncharacterised protein [uncultured archaeon]